MATIGTILIFLFLISDASCRPSIPTYFPSNQGEYYRGAWRSYWDGLAAPTLGYGLGKEDWGETTLPIYLRSISLLSSFLTGFGIFFFVVMIARYVQLACVDVYPVQVREKKFKDHNRLVRAACLMCFIAFILMSVASHAIKTDANSVVVCWDHYFCKFDSVLLPHSLLSETTVALERF
jgi:hypothetical protein